ncbi:MAG: carboxypeptidase-like regulatory domain-containing protein, partial [Anaerolineae bacterium]|nr:carboxypeptidase-like regulatory domain-containing protein [Anaerolineae bacterium]
MISGVVIDNNGPVAGAVVRIQNSEISTISGGDGTFALPSLSSEDPVTITAWASGYYIVAAEEIANPGTSDIEIVLVKHADYDESDYEWISAFTSANDPSNCQNCHSQPDDPSSRLPFDEWQNDAHANSFSSPRYLTMYTGTDISGNQSPPTRKGYNRDYGHFPLPPDRTRPYFGPGYQLDFPGTAGNCAACHAPGAAIDLPYNIDPTHLDDIGTEGITCDFCHKVWDVRFDESGLPYPNMPGVLSFEFRRPAEGHQFFAGPYDDVAPGEDTFSPLQKESQYCAPCHFGVFWDTLIYNSFGEWFESPYSDPV